MLTRIGCVPKHDLVAVSTWAAVYIYDYCTKGEPIRLFDHHKGSVYGLVHLSEHILASVHSDGMLLTGRAGTGAVLGELKLSEKQLPDDKES